MDVEFYDAMNYIEQHIHSMSTVLVFKWIGSTNRTHPRAFPRPTIFKIRQFILMQTCPFFYLIGDAPHPTSQDRPNRIWHCSVCINVIKLNTTSVRYKKLQALVSHRNCSSLTTRKIWHSICAHSSATNQTTPTITKAQSDTAPLNLMQLHIVTGSDVKYWI